MFDNTTGGCGVNSLNPLAGLVSDPARLGSEVTQRWGTVKSVDPPAVVLDGYEEPVTPTGVVSPQFWPGLRVLCLHQGTQLNVVANAGGASNRERVDISGSWGWWTWEPGAYIERDGNKRYLTGRLIRTDRGTFHPTGTGYVYSGLKPEDTPAAKYGVVCPGGGGQEPAFVRVDMEGGSLKLFPASKTTFVDFQSVSWDVA